MSRHRQIIHEHHRFPNGLLVNLRAVFGRLLRLHILVVGCATAAGCTMLTPGDLAFAKKEPEYKTPRQIVPVWSDTVLHQPGEPATRGFGGRIMFYAEDKHKPVQVAGSLVVYAWDDSKGTMERVPDRKYVFPADKMPAHYSESRLGHSYSFWIPWDAAGGPLTHLTLISRFVSSDGTEISSSPAHVVLQGPGKFSPFPNQISRETAPDGIQKVGYELSEDDGSETDSSRLAQRRNRKLKKPSGFQTSEIDLTSGFFDRNMRGTVNTDDDAMDVTDARDLLSPQKEKSSSPRVNDSSSNSKTSHAAKSTETEAGRDPLSARLPPFESRVRAVRAAQLSRDHVRKEPLPAKWLNGLSETPRSSPSEIE